MSNPPTNNLRIAVVRQRYTPHGGAERFVQNMLETLQEHSSIEITIITRKWEGHEKHKFRVIECNPFYLGRLWRDWSFYRSTCKTIKELRFDLVQSHERILCSDIYRAGEGVHREWLHQRKRIRPWWEYIWTTLSLYHQFILRQEKRVFESPRLSAIIANSETTKREIERNFPHIRANITVIPNAVDLKKFHPQLSERYRAPIRTALGIPKNATVSLFVGSGYERKGVRQLLNIFCHLSENHHLIIVGKDKHISRFQEQTTKNELEHRVHFMGAQEDVRPYLGASDLFVFPSLYDPLPNSALEAAAAGLPVLASKTTGAADLTTALGLPQLDPLDTYSWATTIESINQHKKNIDMDRYSRRVMRKNLFDLYQTIQEKKHGAL